MYEYIIAHPEIMKIGFRAAGVIDKLHDSLILVQAVMINYSTICDWTWENRP